MPHTSRVVLFLLCVGVGSAVLPSNTRAASLARSIPAPRLATGADGAWYPVPLPAPDVYAGRRWHTVIFDPLRQRFLAFGGAPVSDDKVWVRPLGSEGAWVPLVVTGTPPTARSGHCAVYDPVGDRMLVFGGDDGALQNDVWELTLSGTPQWSPLTTQSTPPASRKFASAMFDDARNRMILFGGFSGGGYENATWTLDFTTSPPTWQVVTASGTPPAGRAQAAVVYDPTRDRMVVYGGQDGTVDLSDLWTLSFGTSPAWTLRTASAAPGRRAAACAAYDSSHDRMLTTFGSDLWSMNLEFFNFTGLSPSVEPASRLSAAFAYDPVSQSGVFDGGAFGSGTIVTDTWSLHFDPFAGWTRLSPVTTIRAQRYGAFAFYDQARDRFLMSAGSSGSGGQNPLGDLCELKFGRDSAWIQIATGPAGYARFGPAAAYDPVRDRILVFGGNRAGALNDLWQIRLSPTLSIEPLTASGTPPSARWYASATYDPVRDRLLLFGGIPQAAGDPWQLTNLSGTPEWSQVPLVPGPAPAPRFLNDAVYDPVADRLLLYGGLVFGTGPAADLWTLSLDSPSLWTAIVGTNEPPAARSSPKLQYDPLRQRILMYGGQGTDYFDDVWELSTPQLEWQQLLPDGTIPPARSTTVAAYDDVHGRLLISGGFNGLALPDVWRLQFEPVAPTAVGDEAAPSFTLGGFRPNPAYGPVRISFSLTERSPADLDVFDLSGRRVAGRRIESPAPGLQTIEIAPNGPLAPGLYFVKLTQGGRALVARGTVMR